MHAPRALVSLPLNLSMLPIDPLKFSDQGHQASQVQRRFNEHICDRELPLKKFNWS
jgi:hypothetical protein